MSRLDDALFGTPAMAALLDDKAQLQAILDVEAALARAEGAVGVIPADAVAPITAACDAARYDIASLATESARAGNPAIPLVKALTAQAGEAGRWVHTGATSQDIIDTGQALRLRAAAALLDADLARIEAACAMLAEHHADTPMAGRTLGQHATPIAFGLKAAGWLSMAMRVRARLRDAATAAAVLQFGGAAGNLAALGDDGLAVAAALADDLGLALPDMPWHAQRDRLADLAAAVGVAVGAVGKVGRDVAAMMATEVGEAYEPAADGRGGSSAMPHKRNPVACVVALAAATRAPGLVATMLAAMPQEQERGLGGWHAEWTTLADLLLLAAGSFAAMAEALEGLEVDTERMRTNLDLTDGLVMAEAAATALARGVGRDEAHRIVEAASRRAVGERRSLVAALRDDPAAAAHLDAAALARLADPAAHLGASRALIARVLGSYRR